MYIEDRPTKRATQLVFMCFARPELSAWWLTIMLLSILAATVVSPVSCWMSSECQKKKEHTFRGLYTHVPKGREQRNLNWYEICIPLHSSWSTLVDTMWASFEPSLSEQQHQISSLHTWKQWILSAHNKKSVSSTQLRALGCGRQLINQWAKVEHCWHKRYVSWVSLPKNGWPTSQIIYWGGSNPPFRSRFIWGWSISNTFLMTLGIVAHLPFPWRFILFYTIPLHSSLCHQFA